MSNIKKVELGNQGLAVPAIGLGCMGMTQFNGVYSYGETDETEAIATIHRSLELGGNFLDTADIYGPFINEQLIAKAIKGNRDKYIIATKFGIVIDANGRGTTNGEYNGKKEYVKKSIERSLKNLNTDYIDLYYLHRLDPNTDIEETVEAMSELIKEGKVKYIGLSEADSETIRRAHKIHPLTAVQSEYSIFVRQLEKLGVLDTMKELSISLVAYAPVGRGILSGKFQKPEDLSAYDIRRNIPRFKGEQFYENLKLVNEIKKVADEKNITTTQLAIAWVIAKGHVPIPGTKHVKYLEQNIASTNISLTEEDLNQLESIIPLGTNTGGRTLTQSDKTK
jgi:aryl-alcohol dehydrogenase-like predicted oxidoreductase